MTSPQNSPQSKSKWPIVGAIVTLSCAGLLTWWLLTSEHQNTAEQTSHTGSQTPQFKGSNAASSPRPALENRTPLDAQSLLKLADQIEQNPEELSRDTLDRYMEASFSYLETDQIKALEEFKLKMKAHAESSFQHLRQYYDELPRQRFDYRHATLELIGSLQYAGSQEFVEQSYQDNLEYLKSEEFQQLDSRGKTKAMTMPLASARALAQTYENKSDWYESILRKIEENPPDPIQRFFVINLLANNPQAAEYKEKVSRILPASKKYMLEGL